MSDHLISCDPGNGGTNASLALKSGFKSIYFPSVRAAATGDSLGLGSHLELDYEYVDWNGYRYVVGDDVLRVTRRNLERHMGVNRYGNEFHQFLVAVALAKLGVKSGTVDLTLFAPPGMYLDAKHTMQERFTQEGATTIRLKSDKKPRSWNYAQVTVYPEGIGAAACFVLDDSGSVVQSDILSGETLILDLGAYTLDALKLVDGNFNPETLEHATWESGGLNVHLREPVLRTVKKHSEDFELLTVDDIDQVIRRGLTEGDYQLKVAGYTVDLQATFDKYRERYAEWVANNIVDNVFHGLRGIKSLILVGGGAVLIEPYLKEWYGDKLLDRTQHLTTRKIHPTEFNCIGGLRLARMQKETVKP